MRIVIFLFRVNSDECLHDMEWMEEHPLGGTEASAMHMTKVLRELGNQVILTNRAESLTKGCDVFVSTRHWEIFAKGFRPGQLNYLWCHDDADQPLHRALKNPKMANKTYRNIDGVMVLSRYQYQRWIQILNLPRNKAFLTSNGIPSSRFSIKADELRKRPKNLYYGSTPFRGLNLLLKSWPAIHQTVPDAELHIFSSMRIYGMNDTPELDALYQQAVTLPQAHYHGAQGQANIRKVSQNCRLLAYPCTFPETSCITAMEAMASGCVVVTTATGALPETAAGNVLVPPKGEWLGPWQKEIIRLLNNEVAYEQIALNNLKLSDQRDWKQVALNWISRFERDRVAQAETRHQCS